MITNTKGQLLRITPFTASGTWTKGADVGSVIVKVIGGGANGTSAPQSGGAGGYSEKIIDESSLASTETVTVGGASSLSSFGAHCSATGASGVSPGTGSGGNINLSGGRGGTNATCNGGASVFGGSGVGVIGGTGSAALPNTGAGGGGGAAGGAGGSGIIIVYEYSK